MTVSTLFGETGDGRVDSGPDAWATTRAGTNLVALSGSNINIGLIGPAASSFVQQGYEKWDTSSIGIDIIIAAVLSLFGQTDLSTTDFGIEARIHDWGAAVTTADWVAGDDLNDGNGKTLVATFETSGFSTSGYNDFTDVAFVANINKAGITYITLGADDHPDDVAPTGQTRVVVFGVDESGTTKDPKLVVTHFPPRAPIFQHPLAPRTIRARLLNR